MQQMVCRDCGLTLPTGARGCPRCAWNLEVETKFDRLVLMVIIPSLVVLTIVLIAFAVYLFR